MIRNLQMIRATDHICTCNYDRSDLNHKLHIGFEFVLQNKFIVVSFHNRYTKIKEIAIHSAIDLLMDNKM